MDRLRKELTFEGGVNLNVDPHLLKSNEWINLQNMWPYRNKLIGARPSLLHDQDIFPVPQQYWNGYLWHADSPTLPAPVAVPFYGQWFRYLTPLKTVFMGSLDRMAMICVCTASNAVSLKEHFEGEDEVIVTLTEGDVILMLIPNDMQGGPNAAPGALIYPTISGVRLGTITNLTPSLIDFNGSMIAANKTCEYVVQVVKADTLDTPSPTVWNLPYRFTKVNFGSTNLDFRVDGVIVYKNRFVYWRGNKLWFSDPFQPGLIYQNAVLSAYLAVFFDTGLTEDITALGNIYMSDVEEAGKSVLAIWTQHGMLFMTGEPATTIASTPEELFAPCVVNTVSAKAGCVSGASVVKTKFGYIWCGAESVWFMAKGNLPVEVGLKISPRIMAQSFESAGRIFATFDDLCYRLVINAPNVGYNPYGALNEMWCLSFAGNLPSMETAAWFGPHTFTNTDNQIIGGAAPDPDSNNSGLYCCAKLTNINDDKTWYIQPYSYNINNESGLGDSWGTRLGLASISTYLGVDITAPFRMVTPLNPTYDYSIGAIYQLSRGKIGEAIPYMVEHIVTVGGVEGALQSISVYVDENGEHLFAKRPLYASLEGVDLIPLTHKIAVASGYLTLDNPELVKLIDGYELTFKTLNPIILDSWWWPWESAPDPDNIVTLESEVNVPNIPQNVLGGLFNEAVLTTRRIPSPEDKRYNGLTAQLNVGEPEYKIITSNNSNANPNWNKIRISTDNIDWIEFNLFDFDENGIAKYVTLTELNHILGAKVDEELSETLELSPNTIPGIGLKFANPTPLYIDLTAQGWEWFGFVPTGLDNGFGVNILSNVGSLSDYIFATGSVPCCTPHDIHFAKLTVRYAILEARPR